MFKTIITTQKSLNTLKGEFFLKNKLFAGQFESTEEKQDYSLPVLETQAEFARGRSSAGTQGKSKNLTTL